MEPNFQLGLWIFKMGSCFTLLFFPLETECFDSRVPLQGAEMDGPEGQR